MRNSILYNIQIVVSVAAAFGSGLLAFIFWNAAQTNGQSFTQKLLRILALCSALRALEIAGAAYRTARIAAACIPLDAAAVGLLGRGLEMGAYVFLILFLVRPETRKALNGKSSQ